MNSCEYTTSYFKHNEYEIFTCILCISSIKPAKLDKLYSIRIINTKHPLPFQTQNSKKKKTTKKTGGKAYNDILKQLHESCF